MYQFLFLSNLLVEKGIFVALDACEILKCQGLNFICHIVGDRSQELSVDGVENEVRERNLSDVVRVHGPLYGDKESILCQVDAFIFPSFNECFPLVVLEAMKHGLPIISTAVAALPDIIEDKETGFFVEARNAESLAQAMKNVIKSPEMAVAIGLRGKERQQRFFSLVRFEETLSQILREA